MYYTIFVLSSVVSCFCQNTSYEIPITTAPYQVSLQIYNKHHALWTHMCSGAIITQWHIATTAHCTTHRNTNTTIPEHWLQIRAGSAKWYDGGLLVGIRRILINPKYNYSGNDYDISVLKLTDVLPLYVPEICPIGWARAWPAGTEAFLTGWGQIPTTVQGHNVTLIDMEKCSEGNKYSGRLNKRMVCSDATVGEPGGALVMKGVLVGLVSWRGEGGVPLVFSNMATYREFIEYAVTNI